MHILLNSGQNLLKSALETFKELKTPSQKKKMSKNMSRDEHGPEFDDRLIKLVRENPAIYDMSHPHYRRTPVRMVIWDNISRELGSPSRYLQTKWKNIRYNYLQEQKCLETGIFNTNIRKRRFTADLTFLKHTAYRRDAPTGTPTSKLTYNGSDNDSNSFMYPDNLSSVNNSTAYEVIELDHSDDEGAEYMPDVSAFLAPMNDMTEEDSPQDPYGQPDVPDEPAKKSNKEVNKRTTRNSEAQKELQHQLRSQTPKICKKEERAKTPDSPQSNRSSPLLTPLNSIDSSNNKKYVATKNGDVKLVSNGNAPLLSEVTIRPLALKPLETLKRRPSAKTPTEELNKQTVRRKSTPSIQSSAMSDPIELYCLSLVDCLRAMPRSERERVKFEFSKILKDAKYTNQS